MSKRITLKGLADFMTSNPAKQRRIVHDFKYPEEDDGRAKIMYYREARDDIQRYHRKKFAPGWIRQRAGEIAVTANASAGARRKRLEHNSRALRQYADHFGLLTLDLLPINQMNYVVGDLVVSVKPDLHATINGKEAFVKVEYGAEPLTEYEAKVITQVMHEAACQSGFSIPASKVLCLDVSSGIVYKGAGLKAMMHKDVDAACKTIAAIWDDV